MTPLFAPPSVAAPRLRRAVASELDRQLAAVDGHFAGKQAVAEPSVDFDLVMTADPIDRSASFDSSFLALGRRRLGGCCSIPLVDFLAASMIAVGLERDGLWDREGATEEKDGPFQRNRLVGRG